MLKINPGLSNNPFIALERELEPRYTRKLKWKEKALKLLVTYKNDYFNRWFFFFEVKIPTQTSPELCHISIQPLSEPLYPL